MKNKIGLGLLVTFVLFCGVDAQEKKASVNPAQLLPPNAVAWFSINNFGEGIAGIPKYLETFVGKKKADELFDKLKTQIKSQLAAESADVVKATTSAIKSLKSAHFGVFRSPSGNYELAATAEFDNSNTPSNLISLLEPNVYQTTKFQDKAIKRIVVKEQQSPFKNIFVTTFDNILFATTSAELARDSVAKYTADSSIENSLLLTPDYQKFALRNQAFSTGAYIDINAVTKEIAKTLTRKEKMTFDKVDALLGFTKIKSFSTQVYLDGGKICSESSLRFSEDCALYNDFLSLEPSSARDTLKLLPSDSFMAGVSIVSDLKKRWYKTEKLLSENGLLPKSAAESFQNGLNELKDSLDLDFNKIFDVVDDQMAFYMDTENLSPMGGVNNMQDIAYIFKCKSHDKLLSLLGKIRKSDMAKEAQKTFEKIREHKYGGDVIYYIKRRKDKTNPGEPTTYAFSIVDNYLVFGFSLNAIQNVIDAYRNGNSIANSKEYQEAISKMPEKTNSLVFFNGKRLLATIEQFAQGMGENFPNITDSMIGGGLDTAAAVAGNNELSFKTRGLGIFAIFPLAIPTAIAASSMQMGARAIGIGDEDKESQSEGEIELAEQFTPPEDKEALDKLISQLIKDLGSDDADKRNIATDKLKLIGNPAVDAVKNALSSGDPEVKLRARNILLYLKQYEFFPNELSRKVKTLVADIQDMANQQYSSIKGIHYWQNPDSTEGNYSDSQIEPASYYPTFYYASNMTKKLDFSILESDSGIREFSKILSVEKNDDIVRYMVMLLTQYNASAASGAILKLYDTANDRELKDLALVALGWSNDAKVKEKITQALDSDKVGDRRAAFLAIERSTDTAFIDKLIPLLESPDDETRFNAGYTLAKLTRGEIVFNAFIGKDQLTSNIDSIRQWWSSHKANFVIPKHTKSANNLSALFQF